MLSKPCILSLFPNSFNKFNKHEHSCKILYVCLDSQSPLFSCVINCNNLPDEEERKNPGDKYKASYKHSNSQNSSYSCHSDNKAFIFITNF